MAKRKQSKRSGSKAKKTRKTPKWSAKVRAAYKREKRQLIHKYNLEARK